MGIEADHTVVVGIVVDHMVGVAVDTEVGQTVVVGIAVDHTVGVAVDTESVGRTVLAVYMLVARSSAVVVLSRL